MFLSAPLERSAAAGVMQGSARLMGQAFVAILMTLLFSWLTCLDALKMALAAGAAFAVAAAAISSAKAAPHIAVSRKSSKMPVKC